MTTSFRAKFPASAIKNIRFFGPNSGNPQEWSSKEAAALKLGDIAVCFSPFNTADGANAELEVSALILVFNADQNGAMGILLTDDFYVHGSAEAILRERAIAAQTRNSNFSFVTVPFIGTVGEDARKFLTNMQRWGSGTRANPLHGLPDPLVAFFACVGSPLPQSPPIGIDAMAQALIRGTAVPQIADLGTKYSIVMKAASPAISSVTLMETPGQSAAASSQTPAGMQAPVSPQTPAAAQTPATAQNSATPQIGNTQPPAKKLDPAATQRSLEPISHPLNAQADSAATAATPPSKPGTASPATPPATPAAQSAPAKPSVEPPLAPAADATGSTGKADSGFLSIRKRLEARLAGRLPSKTGSGGLSSSEPSAPRAEPASPALKLVSNIRQQMSIASDNLEYRVSTLKSKMLDRLVSCKHNLSEKEQLSLRALEDLRSKMQNKLEYTAARAKEDLSKTASEGSGQVKLFQSKAPGLLADMLAEQEKLLNASTEDSRRRVNEALSGTRDELNKTVSRAQHTLRGLITTTEVNLNQIVNLCSEGMDERIEGFRTQTQILAEGIGLSVESLGEAAKLQSQQSEDEVIKRLEGLSEESLKSLREQSVKAEMECSKLIDKLSREKLVPTLQEKRRVVVELAGFFHDEFTIAMQDLLENRLTDFEPIIRMYSDANLTALAEFKSRWAQNLEQHQRELDEIEKKLRGKIDEYLAAARQHIESMQDITKVTDYVLTSPELIRTRDETCLKFDILAREHVSKAFALTGDKVNELKQDSLDDLTELRQKHEVLLKDRAEESRSRIRGSIKSAMQKIQEVQSRYMA
jgi:hypothetical protein